MCTACTCASCTLHAPCTHATVRCWVPLPQVPLQGPQAPTPHSVAEDACANTGASIGEGAAARVSLLASVLLAPVTVEMREDVIVFYMWMYVCQWKQSDTRQLDIYSTLVSHPFLGWYIYTHPRTSPEHHRCHSLHTISSHCLYVELIRPCLARKPCQYNSIRHICLHGHFDPASSPTGNISTHNGAAGCRVECLGVVNVLIDHELCVKTTLRGEMRKVKGGWGLYMCVRPCGQNQCQNHYITCNTQIQQVMHHAVATHHHTYHQLHRAAGVEGNTHILFWPKVVHCAR